MSCTKEQIDKLIEKLADKTLSFGCVVQFRATDDTELITETINGDSLVANGDPETTDSIIYFYESDTYKVERVLGHPIRIGDVLEKLQDQEQCLVSTGTFVSAEDIAIQEDYLVRKPFRKLLYLYARCGINLSLQEIIEDSGWEIKCGDRCKAESHTYLKSTEASALFDYLVTLFL